ncbi:hypothetical protein KKG71_02330 [Patescibacteria group bacterium]|nr:hypothetical protein [Patescibacteria group bacterium]
MNDDTKPTSPLTGGLPPGTGKSKKKASDFDIPDVVKKKHADLIQLILETESMNDEERDYWFQILPIMTDEQIEKFRAILENEKEQLAKLDAEYQEEIAKLNDKHVDEWKQFESEEERRKRQEAEQKEAASDEDAAEKLLEGLDEL